MRTAAALAVALMLAGCGIDQGATLSCPGPDGAGCDSLSEVYERTAGSNAEGKPEPPRRLRTIEFAEPPRLAPPQVVRVWIAPWEDEDGDLHDHQYLYLVIERAAWDVDRWRPDQAD